MSCINEMEILKQLPLDIVQESSDFIRFKCPICHEGKSYDKKARAYYICSGSGGYIYCHNCGYSSSLYWFIKDNYPQYEVDYKSMIEDLAMEKFLHPEKFKKNVLVQDKKDIVIPEFDPIFEHEKAVEYVESRKIDISIYRLWFADYNSVIIPLYDENFRMFAYQQRYLKPGKLKYKITKIDDNYKKIYNYYNKKYKRSDRVYITEGVFDCDTLRSVGLNSVAVLGASIPPEVLKMTDDIVVVLDNDARGIKEMKRIAEKFSDVRFVILNKDKNEDKIDLNEYYIKYGKDRLLEMLEREEVDSLSLLFSM